MEPGGKALVKVAGGRVIGAAESARVSVERVTKSLGHEAANVDNVNARTRSELEVELDRR
jgi:hypothetical protein